ncbi:hypothetical protein TSTA_024540 [Talaromyces stipitatus ATCC 10500]|uniref:Uncharacterized protein n=1 Tax=Talaromyces stipitatus (strain ATCC 10500 / CBS 375.48 / QM 6759 / NRRL 1006) TaxID=441959 RepID=B8M4D5_TALSN|nr:uncharacterized protein TSTA_024540 [Talaromyces stipitatus ATCC 10500]EED19130.1 hypothetical protein TSTA_024540 [Talaromyces stipitatus ATCC 10500]
MKSQFEVEISGTSGNFGGLQDRIMNRSEIEEKRKSQLLARDSWVAELKTKSAGGGMEEDLAVTTRVGRVVVPSTRAREALEDADSTDATTATRKTTSKAKPTAYLEGIYREAKSLKETLSKQEKIIQE